MFSRTKVIPVRQVLQEPQATQAPQEPQVLPVRQDRQGVKVRLEIQDRQDRQAE